MLIVGILAVVALPRLDALTGFDAIGYADQLKAVLRYAQKSALAQRRAFAVEFGGSLPTLTYSATSNCNGAMSTATYPAQLRSPGGSTGVPAEGGDFSTTWVCFDSMGTPYKSTSVALTSQGTISITGASTILVEQDTGYVR
jgi:MSHA pilin protein MshC